MGGVRPASIGACPDAPAARLCEMDANRPPHVELSSDERGPMARLAAYGSVQVIGGFTWA